MKSFKVKILSLGIASAILFSSTPIFAATSTSNTIVKNSTRTQSTALKSSVGGVHLDFNYGPNGGYDIWYTVDNGGLIQNGDVGRAVKDLQLLLDWQGASIGIDGYFGNATYNAVKSFQSNHGLYPDGIVGKNTSNVLFNLAAGNVSRDPGVDIEYNGGYGYIYRIDGTGQLILVYSASVS